MKNWSHHADVVADNINVPAVDVNAPADNINVQAHYINVQADYINAPADNTNNPTEITRKKGKGTFDAVDEEEPGNTTNSYQNRSQNCPNAWV